MTGEDQRSTGQAAARVGLVGMYASANLGDTAIQTAVMSALRARRPNVEFVGVCTDPADAVRTFGLTALHVSGFGHAIDPSSLDLVTGDRGPDLWERAPLPLRLIAAAVRIDRHMRGMDMLLVSGSGQIDDFWGGPWEQPFRLLAWASAARRQGKPVAFFGVGVDQLLTWLGTRLATAALSRAQLRVLRDPGSLHALRQTGFAAECDVCPDPAFHLADTGGVAVPRAEAAFAVVSPIARNAWPGNLATSYERYLTALAAAADHLQQCGLEVRFVCSQTRMDPPIVPLIQNAMRGNAAATRTITPTSVDHYLREVRGADIVVASRLHALILALVVGTPVVAVSYARKVAQQMADAGLSNFCLELDTLHHDALLGRVTMVLGHQDEIRSQVAATSARLRGELDVRFDRLAAMIPG